MPWSLALLIPAAFFSITLRHYGLFICLLIPIAYIFVCYWSNFLPKQVAAESREQIKIISFNVWSKNTEMDAVSRVVESETPDLLFLQEISRQQLDQLVHHLQSSNNNILVNVSFDSDRNLALLSHFPIVAMDSPGTIGIKVQKLRVATGRADIIVFNVHFLRNDNRQRRIKEIERFINEHLVDNQEPLLLAGDFNTTSQTDIYRSLKELLSNSHDEVGWGFGFTYPATLKLLQYKLPLPAMVRIDHIFYSSRFKATTAKVLTSSGGSDHYPILAKLTYSPF